MTRALTVAGFGLLLIGLGFMASPWPWLALVVPGGLLALSSGAYLLGPDTEVDE